MPEQEVVDSREARLPVAGFLVLGVLALPVGEPAIAFAAAAAIAGYSLSGSA